LVFDTVVGMERQRRNSGRVVFIDPEDRILLQKVLDESTTTTFWLTTGGGVERGESIELAVVRECAEEAGVELRPEDLGSPVATFESTWSFRGRDYAGFDTIYFVRTDHFSVDPSGQDEIELAIILDWKWWTLAELASTSECIVPAELAGLVGSYLRGEIEDTPIRLQSPA
jgi:8-oxo-dGTP pyrophosphatase MutT (NUDIX family)